MVTIGKFFSFENSIILGILAIVPSSFVISQSTPIGFNPANSIISTLASVCPSLSRTPPDFALKGNTCPG